MKTKTMMTLSLIAPILLLTGCNGDSSSGGWPKGMVTAIGQMKNEMVGHPVTYENVDFKISNLVEKDGYVLLYVGNQVDKWPSIRMYVYLYVNTFENENVGKIKGCINYYKLALGENEYQATVEDAKPNNFVYTVSEDHSLGEFESMTFTNTEVSDSTKSALKNVYEHYAKAAVDWFVPALKAKCGEYII